MEAQIEELNQEIAYRTEYLKKEKAEINSLQADIAKELVYIKDQQKTREGKQKENEKAI